MNDEKKQIYKSFAPLGFLATIYKPTYDYFIANGSTCEDVVIDIVGIETSKKLPTLSKLISLRDIYESPKKIANELKITLKQYSLEKRNAYFSLSVHDRKLVEAKKKANAYARTGNDTSLGFTNIIALDFDVKAFHKDKKLNIPKSELLSYLKGLKEKILQKLMSIKLGPSFVVNSGAGLHVYLFLERPFNYTDKSVIEKYDAIKEMFFALFEDDEELEFDRSAMSPYRIFKFPYTKVFGYTYKEQPVDLDSGLLAPSFKKFLAGEFPKYTIDKIHALLNLANDSQSSESQGSESYMINQGKNQRVYLKELWGSEGIVKEWDLFDVSRTRELEYERYGMSLEDVLRGERIQLELRKLDPQDSKTQGFLERLKSVWANILKQFKFQFGISRHFLTVAIHSKLLHYFEIDESFFINWYKNELFPYLVEFGIEDKNDLQDRISGALKRNFERKKRGEPLGVISFLKSYDNSVKSFLYYNLVNEILTKFLREWAGFKKEKIKLETGRIYTFYRLFHATKDRLEIAKFELTAASTKMNFHSVFKEPIKQVYSVVVSKVVYSYKQNKSGVYYVDKAVNPILSFVLPGVVIERLYLNEESLEKLAKLALPDDTTFEEVLMLCDKYNLFDKMITKIGLFEYEELDKGVTGEGGSTLRYKEVDFDVLPFFLNFGSKKSKKLYSDNLHFVLRVLNLLTSHFISIRKVSVPFWGVINKGLVLLPNNSDVTNEVVLQMANNYAGEFNYVVAQLKAKSYEETEKYIGQVLMKLYKYLHDDEISKLIFQYSLGSIFAYYLFNQKKIPLVPSLVIIGPKSTGKSNRVSLFSEEMWLGHMMGGKATIQVLQNARSSTYRFDAYQFMVAPLHFDELTSFPDELIGIIKDQSTSFGKSASIRGRGSINQGATMTPYVRTYMLSVNRFDLKEDAFADRFIYIDLDDEYYHKVLSKIDSAEKYRLKVELTNSIFYVGVFILLNAHKFFPIVDSVPAAKDRSESKKVLISVGGAIAKSLFGLFNISYDPIEYVDRGIKSAITLGDKLWEDIFNRVSDVLRYQKNLASWAIVVQNPLSISQLKNADEEIRLAYFEIITLLLSKMFYLGYSKTVNAMYLLISNQTLKMLGTKYGISNLRSLYEELKNTPFVKQYPKNAIIYDRLYPYVISKVDQFSNGERAWFVGIRIDLLYPHLKSIIETLEPQLPK